MLAVEAEIIAGKIYAHWDLDPPEAKHNYWIDTLTRMDYGTAGTAFARLQKHHHAPSPAEFLAEYQTLHTAPQAERCDHCASSGLVTDTNHPDHWPGTPDTIPPIGPNYLPGECNCNVSTWCKHCPAGQAAKDMLHRHHGKPLEKRAAA